MTDVKKHSTDRKQAATLAVLPFDNLTGNIEQDYFSRGFVEDLIIDLSRFSNLEVLSAQTSFTSDKPRNEQLLAEEIGSEFFLKGTLRRLGETLRINTQLVDPFKKKILWAERYDAPLEKVFDIHDKIIEEVVGALFTRIESNKLAHARNKPVIQLEAYDCWLRGCEFLRQGTIKDDEKARILFERALQIDDNYGRAYAGLSLSYFNEWSCQLWERWDDNEQAAYDFAVQASELDPDDHVIQMVLGRILLFRREFDRADKHLEKALELNPNDADNLVQLAGGRALLGNGEEGIRLFERALRLNPYHGAWYYVFGAIPYFVTRRYKEMIEILKKTPPLITVDQPAYLAAAYAYLDQKKEAEYHVFLYQKAFMEKITYGREPQPGEPMRWFLHVNPFRDPNFAEHLRIGLLKAGLDDYTDKPDAKLTTPVDQSDQIAYVFRKGHALWELGFDCLTVQMPEVKGFIDISRLLANPDERIHCAELIGGIVQEDGVESIDDQARREYYHRIRDLQEELEEAQQMNDTGREEKLRVELDNLIKHLSSATGLGGKSRKIGASAEKARTAVTWRIRSAIRKIELVHPALSRHLTNTIRTGVYCCYSPEKEISWQL